MEFPEKIYIYNEEEDCDEEVECDEPKFLTELNDEVRLDFKEIAKIIEEQL